MSEADPRTRVRYLSAAIGWTLVILILLSIPGPDLPETGVPSGDKLAHFALFAVFGWLWMRSLPAHLNTRLKQVLMAGLVYAVLSEIYQGVLPFERSADVWDVAANLAGLICGSGLARSRLNREAAARSTGDRETS